MDKEKLRAELRVDIDKIAKEQGYAGWQEVAFLHHEGMLPNTIAGDRLKDLLDALVSSICEE